MHCPNCGHDRLLFQRLIRSSDADTREVYCEACHVHYETETRITHAFARRSRGPAERVAIEDFKTALERS